MTLLETLREKLDAITLGGIFLTRAEAEALLAELQQAEQRIQSATTQLEKIVCVKEPDDGVVLLSNDGPCHYDEKLKCSVYDHVHFSPLGDALIALHHTLTKPLISEPVSTGNSSPENTPETTL